MKKYKPLKPSKPRIKTSSKKEKRPPVIKDEGVESDVAASDAPSEKLQKVLATEGMGSRRGLEKEISLGRVKVNGKQAKLGDRVVEGDRVEYQDRRVRVQLSSDEDLRVILYNKPEGQICTRKDPEGRPSVYDFLPNLAGGRWISVGRLDINTSGLLLFTNNGNLANKLMHPSSSIDREYLVRIFGKMDGDKIRTLVKGVELEDGPARFTDITASKNNEDDDALHHWFYCVVMEGRNREVRRLWESVGVQISRLKRVRYGNVFIPSHVRSGQWQELSYKEIKELHETAGMKPPRRPQVNQRVEDTRQRHVDKLRARAAKNSQKNSRNRR
jgi:23S rRNA pseudouridine2605 synthase